MLRVLKPERRLAVSVWGPQDRRRADFTQRLLKLFDLPPQVPDSPDPYRCAEGGKITSILRDAGLKEVEEVELRGKMAWESAEKYWKYVTETSPSIAFALQSISEEEVRRRENEILAALKSIAGKNG